LIHLIQIHILILCRVTSISVILLACITTRALSHQRLSIISIKCKLMLLVKHTNSYFGGNKCLIFYHFLTLAGIGRCNGLNIAAIQQQWQLHNCRKYKILPDQVELYKKIMLSLENRMNKLAQHLRHLLHLQKLISIIQQNLTKCYLMKQNIS